MESIRNYKKYKQYEPQYSEWKQQRNISEAKRLAYINKNPDKINQNDIKRAQSLLRAIDIMDEYSQKNAEDMEVATDTVVSNINGIISTAGILLGMSTLAIPAVKNKLAQIKLKHNKAGVLIDFIPAIIGYFASFLATIPLMSWAAKVQVGASRRGRFEAMRTELKSPNSFAVLNDAQIQKAKEDAQNIRLPEEEKTKPVVNIGIKETFQNLTKLIKKDKEYEEQKAEFEKSLNTHQTHFEEKLSEKDIYNAKRDKQVLTKLVEQLDIASQDYTENIEMATNMLAFAAIESSFITGFISNSVIKALKINPNNKIAMFLPCITGALTAIIPSIYAAKLQKQAARIGRFKAKQEILKNPQSIYYVEDKDIQNIKEEPIIEQKTKTNIIKFLFQVIKDNKEYNRYIKNEGLQEKKYHKALENIQLSEEQIKDAKSLQRNTFKTFNKVDEKSQAYSESVEALGQSAQYIIEIISSYLGVGVAFLVGKRCMNNLKKIKNTISKTEFARKTATIATKSMAAYVTTIITPVCVSEYFITKEQKKASRVANMQAIKELDNYKHYVDYDNLKKDASSSKKQTETTQKNKNLIDFLSKNKH